ncbi:MAG: carbohydrate ABC transporter permease, partial [Spirochaetaceae bacterium]|nr:carbohydrate ABC transporter permease [Spirochaetaceae bacterium]
FGLPENFGFKNYAFTIEHGRLLIGYFNSLFYASFSVVIAIFASAGAAFVFAKDRFPGLKVLSALIIVGLIIPSITLLLPLYILFRELGMTNSRFSIVLVFVVLNIPFCTFFLATYMRSIPRSLEEAAICDGANMLWVFSRVVLPMSRSIIFTLVVFVALNVWNELMVPVTFANSMKMAPVTVSLLRAKQAFTTAYGPQMASIVLVAAPIMALYFAFQTQIVRGMTAGAVKG